MSLTCFDRAGGFSAVRKIVTDFYDRILDEPTIEPYFADVNMQKLVDHQAKFISQVMGGPTAFSDEALYRVHRPLGITQKDFRTVTTILRETLEDHGIDTDDIADVIGSVMQREPMIVTRYE